MNRVRTAGVLVLALGMVGALAACGEDSQDAAADPSRTTPTSSATSTAGAAASETAPTAPVLGPDGLGALKLGMSRDQVPATGIAEPVVDYPYGGCALSQLVGAPGDATRPEPGPGSGIVYVSNALGVAAIEAYPGIETPKASASAVR